ncbi:hypothetical protein GF385_01200 [Candidatus Dependentiae bacterium]|nr:hypothetical protein [Candidatus Dependentiae bacterium]
MSLIKKIILLLLITFNSSKCSNIPKHKIQNDKIKLTTKRIILKSLFNSLSKIIEIHQSKINQKEYTVNYYKLGKILTGTLIDEKFPSINPTKAQKISEALIPIIIEEIVAFEYNNENVKKHPLQLKKQTLTLLGKKIFFKAMEKTIKANFFLDKKNKYYNPTKYLIVYPCAFLDTNNISCKANKNNEDVSLNLNLRFSLKTGTKNILKELIESIITSKKINFGKKWNQKHRKKALAKAIYVILELSLNNSVDNAFKGFE